MSEPTYATAAQCVHLSALGLAACADLQRWAAEEWPTFPQLHLAGAGYGEAMVAPWATADQVRLTGRMCVWAHALDKFVDREITERAQLDDFVDRCNTVVRTGEPDHGNQLLRILSDWQREFAELPDYSPLAAVWERKFDSCLRGHQYNWVVGSARERGEEPEVDVAAYLAHSDSVAVGLVQVPRWVAYGGAELPDRLDVLLPALDHIAVAVRLANDLATIDRERDEPGQNNILMYGVSPDWVRAEYVDRVAAVRRRLAPLVEENFMPAIGLVRLAEWSVGVYERRDMAPAMSLPAAGSEARTR
ncbi:hypothetical protein EV193_110101 [Herbihabitans rhizosphaerae]|uniref:Terpene synthase n=1 Tax=Herbihabitans rhizosphaerae TaxID=1872711 RepID=A0A4Q7KGG6_9PSEU|nr:terpene synthase family protein [Herbihabitans rhizosphaerae]RZS33951.1 hypothetical protein EV193_110101 [Herbihabitans rhizosphaerae]